MRSIKLEKYLQGNNNPVVTSGWNNLSGTSQAIVQFYNKYASKAQIDALNEKIREEVPQSAMTKSDDAFWKSEEATWFVKETLVDAMNEIAPDGYYFSEAVDNNPNTYGFSRYDDEYEMHV